MRKTKLLLVTGYLSLVTVAASAAYPVYNAAPRQITYQAVPANQYVVPVNAAAAVAPTRITGTLPRVGSNATNAGRQYYQPADYDRLADSGLYVGLSVGYSAAINGGISADYAGEVDDFTAVGAFSEENFNSDTVIPLSVSIGAAINNDFRVDFSYSRYSGIEYPQMVMSSDGQGGSIQANATGGAITSNTTMLNVYYNIDSYTGYLMGGSIRPYIGAGVGIALNTIADYVVVDPNTYYLFEDLNDPLAAGQITTIDNISAYHNGGTKENLAYMAELGVTTDLNGGIKLDFFVRYSGLGKVQTSGSIVVNETDWIGDGAGNETPYENVFHYTNWTESGNLSTIDIGARLRLQF